MLKRNINVQNKNEDQFAASDPTANVYVSASAGTGKTKVLADRFVRLLLSGSPINKILCLTFTNAAAAEMQDRIISRLKAWSDLTSYELKQQVENLTGDVASENDLNLAKSLYTHYLELHSKVQIQTIHSLCQKILSRTPQVIVPGTLISNFQSNKLYNQAYNFALINEELKPYFLQLFDQYENGYIKNELVRNFIWKKVESSNLFAHHTDFYRVFSAEEALNVDVIERELIQKHKPSLIRIFGDLDSFNNIDEIQTHFYTQEGSLRKTIQNQCEKFPELALIIADLDGVVEAINSKKAADLNTALVKVANHVFNHYEDLKKEHGFFDYSDLLIGAHKFLKDSPSAAGVLYDLDCAIDHVLVDEAQDLSELQWNIIETITDEFYAGLGARDINRTLFIVGDFKQSIYSFQGSNPSIFLNAKNSFAEKVLDAGKIWKEVEMSISYRSNKAVLDVVNSVTKLVMPDLYVEHKAHIEQEGIVEILDPIELDKPEKSDEWDIPTLEGKCDSKDYLLAEHLASKIFDKLQNEDVAPKDFLILLRKRGELMKYIISSLRRRDIAVSEEDRLVINQELIVQDLIALGNFVLLQSDDFNLACLLKSPFFGISELELQKYCIERQSDSLFSYIKTHALDLASKLEDLLKCYECDLAQFYIRVLEGKGYRQEFVLRFGHKANIIIHHFYNVMFEYCENAEANLQSFVDYMENNDIEINNQSDPSENQIRVMTVHGSKGLEAQIVILADAANTNASRRDGVLWVDGIPYLNSTIDCRVLNVVKERVKIADNEEDKRLLYVAMTRAQRELYFTGIMPHNSYNNTWLATIRRI